MSNLCIVLDEETEITVQEVINVIQITEETPQVIQTEGGQVIITDEGEVEVVSEQTPVPVVAECKIGPSGKDGLDGQGVLQIDTGPVSNGNTVAADQIAVVTYRSVKWLVTIKDSVAGTFRFYEVIAVHNGTTPMHSVYGLIGDSIPVTNVVDILAGYLRLNITNDSVNPIDISAVRITTTV